MSGPTILGIPKRDVLGGIGTALLQIKNARKLTLDDMAEKIGRSDEMLAQYIAGEAEMGVTAWLRAVEEWPDLTERVTYNLDEAEKAFRAKQRSLRLDPPQPESGGSMIAFLTRRIIAAHHREIGRLGGKARAQQERAPIIAKTVQLQRELGWPDDPRLAG